jgi:ABC-type sugar transport system permease subunit
MATELGPTPATKPASGAAPVHHAPKGVGEDNKILSQGKWATWLLAPTIIALGIVIVYPIISAIVMSFQKDAGLDPATGRPWRRHRCLSSRNPGSPVLVRHPDHVPLHGYHGHV